jgi:hypothetical protein
VCRRLADAMPDRRDADRIRHAMFEMVIARVAAIACGYEDANDLDRLRHDPLMKLAVGRCPRSGAALASQSTISRLENAPRKTEAARLCAALTASSFRKTHPRASLARGGASQGQGEWSTGHARERSALARRDDHHHLRPLAAAAREACSKRHVSMTISLAFLVPAESSTNENSQTTEAPTAHQ